MRRAKSTGQLGRSTVPPISATAKPSIAQSRLSSRGLLTQRDTRPYSRQMDPNQFLRIPAQFAIVVALAAIAVSGRHVAPFALAIALATEALLAVLIAHGYTRAKTLDNWSKIDVWRVVSNLSLPGVFAILAGVGALFVDYSGVTSSEAVAVACAALLSLALMVVLFAATDLLFVFPGIVLVARATSRPRHQQLDVTDRRIVTQVWLARQVIGTVVGRMCLAVVALALAVYVGEIAGGDGSSTIVAAGSGAAIAIVFVGLPWALLFDASRLVLVPPDFGVGSWVAGEGDQGEAEEGLVVDISISGVKLAAPGRAPRLVPLGVATRFFERPRPVAITDLAAFSLLEASIPMLSSMHAVDAWSHPFDAHRSDPKQGLRPGGSSSHSSAASIWLRIEADLTNRELIEMCDAVESMYQALLAGWFDQQAGLLASRMPDASDEGPLLLGDEIYTAAPYATLRIDAIKIASPGWISFSGSGEPIEKLTDAFERAYTRKENREGKQLDNESKALKNDRDRLHLERERSELERDKELDAIDIDLKRYNVIKGIFIDLNGPDVLGSEAGRQLFGQFLKAHGVLNALHTEGKLDLAETTTQPPVPQVEIEKGN